MVPVITTRLGVRDAECQSERPLPLYQRHSSSKILGLNARLNYWLKCKFLVQCIPQYILIMDELYRSDRELDLERMVCSKQLYLKSGLVETTTINH